MTAGRTVIFFPRYTTVFDGFAYSDPVEVLDADTLDLNAVVPAATFTSIDLLVEGSNDLETWSTEATVALTAAGSFTPAAVVLATRFVRVRLANFVGGSGVTLLVQGTPRAEA